MPVREILSVHDISHIKNDLRMEFALFNVNWALAIWIQDC